MNHEVNIKKVSDLTLRKSRKKQTNGCKDGEKNSALLLLLLSISKAGRVKGERGINIANLFILVLLGHFFKT